MSSARWPFGWCCIVAVAAIDHELNVVSCLVAISNSIINSNKVSIGYKTIGFQHSACQGVMVQKWC